VALGHRIKIEATVIDIKSDTPKSTDRFFVDTNVWLFAYYPRATLNNQERLRNAGVLTYIDKARQANAVLYRLGLSLSEVANVIEREESKSYFQFPNYIPSKKIKEYRYEHLCERRKTLDKIRRCWLKVKLASQSIDLPIDDTVTDDSLVSLQGYFLDGYDIFFYEAMKSNNTIQIITDDCDFATIPGIQVFTESQGLIAEAIKQGKILTR